MTIRPWHRTPAPATRPELAPPATGPTTPHRHVPAPPAAHRLPSTYRPETASVWFLGAHGGAGETTLTGLLDDSRAADHEWPACPTPARVVLVARTTATGLLAARGALSQWAAGAVDAIGPVDLLGLALLADAPGRLPRPLTELAELVAGGAPRAWLLPWVEAWRLGAPPAEAHLPPAVRRFTHDVTTLAR